MAKTKKPELSKTEKKYNRKDVFSLKAIFDDADVDGSGEIDAGELRKVLNKSNLGDAADDFFKAIDKDGNKKIGFDEYLKAYYRKATAPEIKDMLLWVYPLKVERPPSPPKLSENQKREIKSIFVLYDMNKNGVLDKKELNEALKDTGYDDDEIEEMFDEYDVDGDGDINLGEFEKMLEGAYL